MIRCSNCSNMLEDDARFCDVCGHPVQTTVMLEPQAEMKPMSRICPFCKNELDEADIFCAECGSRVDEIPVVVQPPVADGFDAGNVSVATEQQMPPFQGSNTVVLPMTIDAWDVSGKLPEEAVVSPEFNNQPESGMSSDNDGQKNSPISSEAEPQPELFAQQPQAGPQPEAVSPQPQLQMQSEESSPQLQPNPSEASSVQASESIPNPVYSPTPSAKDNKSKDKLIKGFGIALVVTVVVIVFLVLTILITGSGSAGKGKLYPEYCFYLKDNELYTVDTNKKATLVTSKLYEDEKGSFGGLYLYRDGNKVLYPDRIDDEADTSTLNLVNLNKKDGKTKIDSDVYPFLYLTTADFSNVIYVKENAGYQYNVSKKDKEKFPQNAYPVAMNEKMTDYLLLDDEGRMYVKFGKKDKEKIADDVSYYYVRRTEFSSNSLILFTEYDNDDETYAMYAYKKGVKNYLLDSDSVGAVLYRGDTGYIVAYDNEDNTADINYYDGSILTNVITAKQTIGYSSNYRDHETPMCVVTDEDGDNYLLIRDTKIYLSMIDEDEIVFKAIYSRDGSRIALVTYEEDGDPMKANTAYLFDIQKKGKTYTLKPVKTIFDINYYSAYFDGSNKFVYLQDWDFENLNGDLYYENKHISSDVYSLIIDNGNYRSDIYYLTDYDKKTGADAVTLNVSDGRKNKVVSTDVRETSIIIGENAVYYIYDYSQKHGYGDLYCYSRNKSAKIDTDVEDARLSVTTMEETISLYY